MNVIEANGRISTDIGYLKPCPFCGGAPSLVSVMNSLFGVTCSQCGAAVFCGTTEQTFENWNRRVGE